MIIDSHVHFGNALGFNAPCEMVLKSMEKYSIDKVKGFVKAIEGFDGYFDLASGRYVIDAKSIMGIFSMDLSKLA